MMLGHCKIGAISFFVSDVAKTETFYRDVLGLEVQNMGDDGQGNDWLMGSTANEISLVFFKGEVKAGNTPVIVFELEAGGIDDVVAGLSEKGVTIVTPVSHAPDGWTADVADPDGHVVSMYQSDQMPKSLE
jgi:predicted enzyme related to lactoylglutathione lyase